MLFLFLFYILNKKYGFLLKYKTHLYFLIYIKNKFYKMKYLKQFEDRKDSIFNEDFLKDILDNNPIAKDHDFYLFIAKDTFVKDDDGRYTKSLDIERMIKISGDKNSIANMQGMQLRIRFQNDSKLYYIWLPKELDIEVEGKGTSQLEPWTINLIDEHKLELGKITGDRRKQVYDDLVKKHEFRRDSAPTLNKFNL
jgi:hypothetical protein